jgi:hypothetical protein
VRRILLALTLAAPGACLAKLPIGLPCPDWPTSVAEVAMKNAKMVDIADLDESKTQAKPVAIQQIGKDLYRQVYDITFHSKSGKTIHVVTINDASSKECSMSDVKVYQVSEIPG